MYIFLKYIFTFSKKYSYLCYLDPYPFQLQYLHLHAEWSFKFQFCYELRQFCVKQSILTNVFWLKQ